MFTMVCSRGRTTRAGRSQTHNPKVAGSNPAPATMNDEGLADAAAANLFRLPRLHPGIPLRRPWLRHLMPRAPRSPGPPDPELTGGSSSEDGATCARAHAACVEDARN